MVDRSELERVVAGFEPGGRLVAVQELTGGVSANVFGLDIVTRSGAVRRVVFRQHGDMDFKDHAPGVTAIEHGVLAALHREGLSVPEPHHLDVSGAVTAPYLIIEWIDGSTDVASAHLPRALDQMARFLVGLHALDPDALAVPGLDDIEDPTAAIGSFLPPDETGARVRAALSAAGSRREPHRRVLLHGDFWPGNVMWRDGRLAAVIDWEDASIGDPAADLAGARIELLCSYGNEAMELFTGRYLELSAEMSASPRLDRLPVWEAYASASALATMSGWGLDPADEARRRHLTQGVLELAVAGLSDPAHRRRDVGSSISGMPGAPHGPA